MVLPSTIAISSVVLKVSVHSARLTQQHPSRLALLAAGTVTVGFFSGVLFDPNHASSKATASVSGANTSSLGIVFGAASSVMSAFHAVLIKKGLVCRSYLPR